MAFDATKPEYQAQILSQPLRDNFNSLKTQLDFEHNENGTHKDALKKSGDVATGELAVKKSSPSIRLIGTEVNAQDMRIVETGGYLKIQKNLGTELSPAWTDMFSLNSLNYLLGNVKITQDNLDSSTQIPDGRLAQITTAGKIASSALPANFPTKDATNTFTNPQVIQGSDAGLYLDNNIDTTYKAEFKKDSDTTAKILIKNKSDGTDAAVYTYGADGNLTSKKLTAQTQLVSQVATGTPPLVVSSSTVVNNLNSHYWNGEAKPSSFTGSTYGSNYKYLTSSTAIPLAGYLYGLVPYSYSWENKFGLGRLDGWVDGASSASGTFPSGVYTGGSFGYGESRVYSYVDPAIGAGTYTITQLLQALVNTAHYHRELGWTGVYNCNCNCNCNCTS